MKKYIYILFLVCIFFMVGCTQTNNYVINISDRIFVGENKSITLTINDELISDDDISWTLSNYECAEINNGVLVTKSSGIVVINAVYLKDVSIIATKEVNIIEPFVEDIEVTGQFEVIVNKTVTLKASVIPSIITSEVFWKSEDLSIATVKNGVVKGISIGETDIIVSCDDFEKKIHIIVSEIPSSLEITSKDKISVNEIIHITNNVEEECMISSTNTDIVYIMDEYIKGLKAGKATLLVQLKRMPNISCTFEIEVTEGNNIIKATDEETEQINAIISKMNTTQLVGEMFNISFSVQVIREYNYALKLNSETGLPDASFGSALADTNIVTYLNDYPFGNYTIINDYTKSLEQLKTSIKTLNKMGKDKTGVNPFIFMDYAGGNLQYIDSYGSNSVIAYNQDATLAYNIGNTLGKEYSSLGINGILSNYASHNSSISFGTDSNISGILSSSMKDGYHNNGIMMGAGQAITTIYYDKTKVESEINQMDNIFKAGFECVCVPLSYFFANGYKYNEISFDYISKYRNEYNGIIMANLTNPNYVSFSQILKALEDGCDMFYFDMEFMQNVPQNDDWNSYMDYYKEQAELPFNVYNTILTQISEGTISIERIKESVFRILLSKLRNGILDDESNQDVNMKEIKEEMSILNTNFISVKGNMDIVNTEKPIIIISDANKQDGNPFGYILSTYLKSEGFKNCNSYLLSNISISQVLNEASSVGSIYILINNMSDSKLISRTLMTDFVQELYDINPNICIIFDGDESLQTYFPYLNNFIFLNNYYNAEYSSLIKVLTGEGTPNYVN